MSFGMIPAVILQLELSYAGPSDLQSWAHAANLFSPSCRIAGTPTGLGLVADRAIEEGDALVRVPLTLCVTAARAHGSPEVGALLAPLDPPPEAHVAIAAWLMRAADHPPDPLRPWLASLPGRFDCTLEWEESSLDELQTSPDF